MKVISVDDNGKMSLSIKQAGVPKKSVKPVEIDWEKRKVKGNSSSFEDRISKFLKDSEERFPRFKKDIRTVKGADIVEKVQIININLESAKF